MSEHTKGLLRVGRPGAIVADHPVPEMSGSDAVEYYGGHMVAESVTAANARRLVACWNACYGLPTDELEQKGLMCAVGTQLLLLEQHRDTLLAALNGVAVVMNNSQGVAGWHQNGAIATWDELLPEVVTALDFVGHPIPSHAEFILHQIMDELQEVMVELDSPGGPVDGAELWERIKAARDRVLKNGALHPQQAQPDANWTEATTTPTEQDYRELQAQHDALQSRLKGALDMLQLALPYVDEAVECAPSQQVAEGHAIFASNIAAVLAGDNRQLIALMQEQNPGDGLVLMSDIAALQRYTLGGECDYFGSGCNPEMEQDDEGEYVLLADALALHASAIPAGTQQP